MRQSLLSFSAALLVCALFATTEAQAQWTVRAINVAGGAGSTDNDFNGHGEVLALWDFLDANPGHTGSTGIFAGSHIWNVANNHTDTSATINYHPGNVGQFGGDLNYSAINGGAGLGGEDFSVRGLAKVTFDNAGTYRVSIGSDDGRYLRLHGATFENVSGQGGSTIGGTDAIIFPNNTGHAQTTGQFTVGAGQTVVVDGWFWERGGGDSLEISIASGAGGACCGGFELLSDGALGGTVSVAPATAADLSPFSQGLAAGVTPGFNVQAFNLSGGTLDNVTETKSIWDDLDAGGNGNVGGHTVANVHSDTTGGVIDYAGGGGNFAINNPYSDISGGAGLGGDDFSVRAGAFLGIPEGTWTISVASDDGRRLELNSDDFAFSFDSKQGQQDLVGANVLGLEGTTGHAVSFGTFTIDAADLVAGSDVALVELDAFFFERGGGDSFEIGIAPGQTDNTSAIVPLADGTFGFIVSQTPFAPLLIPEPTTIAIWSLLAMGMAGFGLLRYRRKK